jgi:hypothetical protein
MTHSAVWDFRPSRFNFDSIHGIKKVVWDHKFEIAIVAGSIIISVISFNLINGVAVPCGALNFNKTDTIGVQILNGVRKFSYWLIAGKGIFDLGKCVLHQDYKAAGSVVISSLFLYAAMFFLPAGLTFIGNIFS